jgi:hypothetical protein
MFWSCDCLAVHVSIIVYHVALNVLAALFYIFAEIEANAGFRWHEVDGKLGVIVFNERTTVNALRQAVNAGSRHCRRVLPPEFNYFNFFLLP